MTARTEIEASEQHVAYLACRVHPLQSVAVRRNAILFLAAKAASKGGHLDAADELLYLNSLAWNLLPDPMRAFLALVMEIAAPGVPCALDRILPRTTT